VPQIGLRFQFCSAVSLRHGRLQSVKRMIIIILATNPQTNLIQNQFTIKIIINLHIINNITAAAPPFIVFLFCFPQYTDFRFSVFKGKKIIKIVCFFVF
jgi:hypothetical protein